VTQLPRRDLRLIYTLLNGSRDPEVPRLQDELRRMIAERAGEQERGAKVFEIRLPLYIPRTLVKGKRAGKVVKDSLAPTMNVYSEMEPWAKEALREALDFRILAETPKWPKASLQGSERKRAVRVTRYSSAMPDEITVDVLGGKAIIDRLVQAEILAGDHASKLAREARWESAPPLHGSLLVEVFELLPPG